jgi:hypothetical protein
MIYCLVEVGTKRKVSDGGGESEEVWEDVLERIYE